MYQHWLKKVFNISFFLFKLIQKIFFIGFTLHVEENAGAGASFHNEDYQNAGAKIVSRTGAYASNIILKVRQPNQEVCLIKKKIFRYSSKTKILFFYNRILVYFKINQH